MKIQGMVVHGQKKGKKLGFPTANIHFSGDLEDGIYAGKVIFGEKEYRAGIFRDKKKNLLEAHILDFMGNLYGQIIEVEVIQKIREVKKFKNDIALREQILLDINAIKKCLPA